MKKRIVYCFIFFCAVILQTSVLPLLSPAYATGDLILMLILSGAVLDGFFAFFKWAIFIGIVYDLATFTPVGVHALIFLLVVYFVSFFSRRFSVEIRGVGRVLLALFVIVATLVSHAVISLLAVWEKSGSQMNLSGFGNLKIIGVQIVYNIFLFFFCFVVFRKIKKFFALD